jgi:hypothetical protein
MEMPYWLSKFLPLSKYSLPNSKVLLLQDFFTLLYRCKKNKKEFRICIYSLKIIIMKKLMTVMVFALLGTAINTYAQPGGGRGFDPAAMKERLEKEKKQLKDELKLNDVQADSVQAINAEFRGSMRGMRDMTQEERQNKMKEINDLKLKRWSAALKDEALAKKVADFYKKQMEQMMQNRPGGGKR